MPQVLRAALGTVLIALCVAADELPVRVYTTADGLVQDHVLSIRRDSHGYLWFGTAEGLSIFDGYQFTSFGVADGLPNRAVTDVLETRQGEYWIATNGASAGSIRDQPRGNIVSLTGSPRACWRARSTG